MTSGRNRGSVPLAVMLFLAALFVIGVGAGQMGEGWRWPRWLSGDGGTVTALRPSQPTWVEIPSIEVGADVFPVGLDADGAIAAPPLNRAHEAGWYAESPSPGQAGAAVIVGHVDDESGPAVFHGLAELSRGSRIEVTRQDGQVAVFEVTDVRRYDKEYLPPEEVYRTGERPELRLITCGGEWVGGDVGYTDNVVVFAALVDSR